MDCIKKGRQVYNYGKDHHRSTRILNESDVKEMRLMRKDGYTTVELGKIFNVNSATVSRICNRKSWAWLD